MMLIVGCVAAFALIATVVLLRRRERSTSLELEHDWWPEFEREFRAYAERTARSRRGRGRPIQYPRPQPQ